ncbi:hypothetical protein AB205_0042030 [Aquarana catesbeiana]|uniref:Uncharacterized protein n=1 Tax=Aquarana catesbeiana TaxID=8400 RepID=A0A2G9QNH5_AQUCT|nr:hypothetical protein AB205_0042030 [Aquarana catesbeiana]
MQEIRSEISEERVKRLALQVSDKMLYFAMSQTAQYLLLLPYSCQLLHVHFNRKLLCSAWLRKL